MKHFDFVMKHGSDIILLIDNDMNIVEANERAVETYGFPRDKLIGMNLTEIRTPRKFLCLPNMSRSSITRARLI